MTSKRVLVIGGTGYFGRLIVDDLHRYTDCEPVIASRRPFHPDRFETVVADLANPASVETALSGIAVAICAAGPFQRLPATLAELCIRRGIHYIDVADDRNFVRKVRSLAMGRVEQLPAICSGWSTVSALSGLLVAIGASGMNRLDSVYIHMAPGNRGARNAATIESLLHSVGQTFSVWRDGRRQTVRGWSEPRDFRFPAPVGNRRGYLVDVPDHELFPNLFHSRTVEFRAGAELKLLNAALSLLSRRKTSWASCSGAFQRIAAWCSFLGHDSGAIGVEVTGPAKRRVSLVALKEGQRIAAMPASIMTRLLLSGSKHQGLVSHANWLTCEELRAESERRGFRLIVEEL